MTKPISKTTRVSPEAWSGLEVLFKKVFGTGQRGTAVNHGLELLGQTANAAMAETEASLKIAVGCAAGEDWNELADIIYPEHI